MYHKTIKRLLLIILPFIFYGCTIPTDFYIHNLTNEIKTIRIKYHERLSEEHHNNIVYNYVEGVITPREFDKFEDNQLKLIDKNELGDSFVEINLQPTSTTRIANSINYLWLNKYIESIEIENEVVDKHALQSKSQKIKTHYVYLIE